jgi:superfamily II DNA or RNA helicase/HKD family nuclease
LGYRVRPFDASPELVALASAFTEGDVKVRSFAEIDEVDCYDGVWACASLLHVPEAELPAVLGQLWQSLKPGGAFYLSFRLGSGERHSEGRHFTDADETAMRRWFNALPDAGTMECWTSNDLRPGRTERWLNAIATRRSVSVDKLIPGGASPFLPHLCEAVARATEVDIAVAFIKTTGLRLLLPDLLDALSADRRARVRVLTSDYLDVTDPDALALLMLLQQSGAHVRVYESKGSSFHLKAYLFTRFDGAGRLQGTAFIGSSNISRQALQEGLEWNYRISYPGDSGFLEARNRFEDLFCDARTVALTDDWIRRYRARRALPLRIVEPGSHETEPAPAPTSVQERALEALTNTRDEGYRRGLVVMATGLGKTWLAAFDVSATGAKRVLFVAHREEILQQAAETFLRIRPTASVGFYQDQRRDEHVDVLCASIQTLGKTTHLGRFARDHFDYVIVDEFHHAAAATYRRLLQHFEPRFLLGLTATPDRTDQSDILSLCDDNLVFRFDLVEGVNEGLLAPFSYFGIFDETVDYREIPWRNGRFDLNVLSVKLATLGRARHALAKWREHAKERTLSFCVSIRHADFMAEQFTKAGIRAAAVHGQSATSRGEALAQLRTGELRVIFSVDLFNEGVDLPEIDTVMMLRPTESKILFLQQLGRGLRRAPGKERLVALDFIGNHHGFLHKPQALLGIGPTYGDLARFAREAAAGRLELPEGCFVNFDLRLVEFLASLESLGAEKIYDALKGSLGRRPTLLEFYRASGNLTRVRQQTGSWFELVQKKEDLETPLQGPPLEFLRELEKTKMVKSYKMVLLEAFQELDGWATPPSLADLARRSWDVLQRRRSLLVDVPSQYKDGSGREWRQYWRGNPVNAWIGGNTGEAKPFFRIDEDRLVAQFAVQDDAFPDLVQEIVDYKLATYEGRRADIIPIDRAPRHSVAIPYFPNIQIACGHFRTGTADAEEFRHFGEQFGKLDPQKHFVARAVGNSMDGGKQPVRHGDYLLLERITPSSAGSITGSVLVIERQDETGDYQYLLRTVVKRGPNDYILRANNPAYSDMVATDEFRTLARLKDIISPLEMMVGKPIMREDIAPLFGLAFNPGNWNVGHVVLNELNSHVLLVTLSKRGKSADHQYVDHWIDDGTFQWMSQNQTTPESKRGQELIHHAEKGIAIHLFVREEKLAGGKGAPFVYYGSVDYVRHSGRSPMNVVFALKYPRS